MNDRVRRTLATIVTRFGRDVWDDPRRCEAVLRDLCNGYPGETAALVAAVKQHIPEELAVSSVRVPWEVLRTRQVQRLVQHLALSEQAAEWAVESWALALGRVSEEETARLAMTQTATSTDASASVPPISAGQPGTVKPDGGEHIVFVCGGCDTKLRIPQWAVGKYGKCPRCGTMLAFEARTSTAKSSNAQIETAPIAMTEIMKVQESAGRKDEFRTESSEMVSRRRRRRPRCPECGSRERPVDTTRISSAGWTVFAILLVFFWPLFWIGLLIKEPMRVCAECRCRLD